MHESFVSDSSDLSILTCSHAVLSEERHYFSFSIILVLYRSHCLIIFSPTECESPLNRALSVALHNITHSAAVMFCEAHLKKRSSFAPPPPPPPPPHPRHVWGCATVILASKCNQAYFEPLRICWTHSQSKAWPRPILVKRESFSIHRLLLFFKKIENDWDE